MSDLLGGIAPRARKLSTRRSTMLSALDVGSHKIVCVVAELEPLPDGPEGGRTHRARIVGIGHQRSAGIRRGGVVDLAQAEGAIRAAVDAAERMARVEVREAIVAISGGRIGGHRAGGAIALPATAITDADTEMVVSTAVTHGARPGRTVLHVVPLAYGIDGSRDFVDPRGMVGAELSCDLSLVSADQAAVRTLMLAVERCHVSVDAVVAAPCASALACAQEDEAEMGVAVVDLGGGTTSIALMTGGNVVHCEGFAVGGIHITMDLARGLSTRVGEAERLKATQGNVMPTPASARDTVLVPRVDEGDRDVEVRVPRSELTRFIRPRVEEILELSRDRMRAAGFVPGSGQRVILTGGASQLGGLPELAKQIFGAEVRVGRPLAVKGLPEAAKGPAFSAALGLVVHPQVAAGDRIEIRRVGMPRRAGGEGYIGKVSRWLRDSF